MLLDSPTNVCSPVTLISNSSPLTNPPSDTEYPESLIGFPSYSFSALFAVNLTFLGVILYESGFSPCFYGHSSYWRVIRADLGLRGYLRRSDCT